MEFARAKGYSDKLSDVVLRGMTGREREYDTDAKKRIEDRKKELKTELKIYKE